MCDPWLVVIYELIDALYASHVSLVVAVLSIVITAIVTFACCVKKIRCSCHYGLIEHNKNIQSWLFYIRQYCNVVKLESSHDRVHLAVTLLTG